MKFSPKFNRDWDFYSNPLTQEFFSFSGKPDSEFLPKIKSDSNGKTAKECFHVLDSTGKVVGCCDSVLLLSVFKTKASVNFQIKQWANMFRDGSMLPVELTQLEKELDMPSWVVEAVVRQSGRKFELCDWHKEYIINQVKKITKVLFLDLDGVMCTDYSPNDCYEHLDKHRVAYLNEVMRQTNCHIVIISQRRVVDTLEQFKEMFDRKGFQYTKRIIGCTPDYFLVDKQNNVWSTRTDEIRWWLDNDPLSGNVETYCILDDEGYQETEFKTNAIKIDGWLGFEKENIKIVVNMLNGVQ